MLGKPPAAFPKEQRTLSDLGTRIKLSRLRQKLSGVVVQRSGISRNCAYKVEVGDPDATMGKYLWVMAVLALEADFHKVNISDKVGHKMKDLALEALMRAACLRRKVSGANRVNVATAFAGRVS